MRNGKIGGLCWGLAQSSVNILVGVLYLASGELYYNWPKVEVFQVENMYIAVFCILFGAFTAG